MQSPGKEVPNLVESGSQRRPQRRDIWTGALTDKEEFTGQVTDTKAVPAEEWLLGEWKVL